MSATVKANDLLATINGLKHDIETIKGNMKELLTICKDNFDNIKKLEMITHALDSKIDQFTTTGSVSKSTGRTVKTSKPVEVDVIEQKFPVQRTWFQNKWKMDKDSIIEKYCTDEMINKLKEHMKTPTMAKKKDDAKLAAEAGFIYREFISKNTELKKRVNEDYSIEKDEYQKSKVTPVSKD